MRRFIINLVWYAALIGCLYGGEILMHPYVANLAAFLVGIWSIIATMALFGNNKDLFQDSVGWRYKLVLTIKLVLIGFLVAVGWTWTVEGPDTATPD